VHAVSSIIGAFASIAVSRLAIFAIGLGAERLMPAQRRQPSHAIVFNINYGIVYSFISAIAGTALAGISIFSIGVVVGSLIELPGDGWAIIPSAIIFLLVTDFAEYIFHRAQHRWSLLWHLHSLHHSDCAVNVTTTLRHHWLDLFLRSIFVYPFIGLILHPPAAVLIVYSISDINNFFAHMNIKLSLGPFWMVLNGPQYHRVHHSDSVAHQNKNFAAIFPVFDLMFNTYYRPAPGEYPTTGLVDHKTPAGMLGALMWPFFQAGAVRIREKRHPRDPNRTAVGQPRG
jgi:sterol desaturase/sphingolipid hydroxylase (fatty acid hydroxylase superfamily)